MGIPREALESQVLQLPTAERIRLLDRLILSLDEDEERDAAWNALAAARDVEIESGVVQEVDGATVIADLRAKYG